MCTENEWHLPTNPEWTAKVRDAVRSHGFSERAVRGIEVYELDGRFKVRLRHVPVHESKRLLDLLAEYNVMTDPRESTPQSVGKYGVN